MRKLIILLIAVASACWSIPKPMESITNYNVMMVHCAYSKDEGFLDEKDTLTRPIMQELLLKMAQLQKGDDKDCCSPGRRKYSRT